MIGLLTTQRRLRPQRCSYQTGHSLQVLSWYLPGYTYGQNQAISSFRMQIVGEQTPRLRAISILGQGNPAEPATVDGGRLVHY